ncbi:MAG: Rieske 2Fe-2S domain-containing protein, partial [Acidimicrobiales bacterium]
SSEADRQAAADALSRATDSIARRPFLGKALAVCGGIFGIAILFPVASLGPRPGTILYRTAWGVGTRLVNEDGQPIRPGDLPVNGILTAFPASNPADPQGPVLVINITGNDYRPKPGHEAWNVGGIVAFSKICTHAACPVGLYNVQSHQLVCPCHQSTFNVLTDCTPVFGPAPRALPQLPLALDSDGFLISQTGFDKPVGPGFWNRG